MHFEAQVLERLEALTEIEDEWRALWREDTSATPFQSPDWLIPWTRWLWGGGRLRIVAIRASDRLTAVAPFFLWGYGSKPEMIRLSFLGSGISDYLGMTAIPTYASDAARLVFSELERIRGEWHVCDLQELHPCSPLLRSALPPLITASEASCSVCPVLELPESVDALMAGLAAHFRRNLRCAEKLLRSQGNIEFVEATARSAASVMSDLFRLHEARWQEQQEEGMFATPRVRSFHLDVAARFAEQGLLRLFAVQVNGATVAVQYNFFAHGRTYCYLSGFDPEWKKFSPGAVAVSRSIQHAVEEGSTELDFLRKRETFKHDWGAHDRVNRQLLLTHSAALVGEVA